MFLGISIITHGKQIDKSKTFLFLRKKKLNWDELQSAFKKILVRNLYKLVKKYFSIKEYNDYLILGVPTDF